MPSPRSERSTPAPILILLVLACVSALGLAALKDVSLRVSPRSGFAPLKVRVEVIIPRDRKNRGWSVFFACAGQAIESSRRELSGDQEPSAIHETQYTLPHGCEWHAQAALYRTDGLKWSQPVTLLIMDRGE